jgi:hypothetical protein
VAAEHFEAKKVSPSQIIEYKSGADIRRIGQRDSSNDSKKRKAEKLGAEETCTKPKRKSDAY